MSRIGKKPVSVPGSVKVQMGDRQITVTGPKGTLKGAWRPEVSVQYDDAAKVICVARSSDEPEIRALHGTTRALIANMIEGVEKGFAKSLEIHGVGYNVKLQGRKLLLNLGFMGRGLGKEAQFSLDIPEGVTVEVTAATNPGKFKISGVDKYAVGQFAAEIYQIRPAEPYLGKGVRYEGQQIRRKQGKAFGSGA